MPFGLANAPATFERFMERAMRGILGKFVHVYLDDILIVSETWELHVDHLRAVFERIRMAGLKLKPSKCQLVAQNIKFLGHILAPDGLKKDEEKVRAMREFQCQRIRSSSVASSDSSAIIGNSSEASH